MGERKTKRVKMVLPIRISGRDSNGNTFSQLAHTLDFSRTGARLGEVQAGLQVGSEITVGYKRNHGQFIVRWVLPARKEAGIESLDREKLIFLELQEGEYLDEVDVSESRRAVERLQSASTEELTTASAEETSVEAVTPEATGRGAEARPGSAQSTAVSSLGDLKRKVQELGSHSERALKLVVDASQQLLSASGSAVAVATEGNWICRASSGIAPRIGVQFRFPKGLTGEAVATGDLVICGDTEEDNRVNPSVWRSVQLRSVVTVPIIWNTRTIGILEAYADEPHAFGEDHVPLLRDLGEILAEILMGSNMTSQ